MGLRRYLGSICFAAFLLVGCGMHAPPAHAQFLGYTSPQTTTSAPFGGTPTTPTSVACAGVGTPQVSSKNAIQNVGQSAHFVYLISTDITIGTMVLQGSQDGTTYNNISDVASIAGSIAATPNSFLVGSGYYNFLRVSVTCATGGHFAVQYSGTSVTPGALFGAQLLTQFDKTLLDGVPANTSAGSISFLPPFGNSGGIITVFYDTAPPTAGPTLAVTCTTPSQGQAFVAFQRVVPPQGVSTGSQQFVIPPIPCAGASVSLTTNGIGASGKVYLDYLFNLPGVLPNSNSYAHISATTANVSVKANSGTLHTLTINTGATGIISIFDMTNVACNAAGTANPVAVITSFANDPAKSITFDAWFINGICIKPSVTGLDLTANFN